MITRHKSATDTDVIEVFYLTVFYDTVRDKFAHTQKHNMKDILQAIKGWCSAITRKKIKKTKNKQEMIVHFKQKAQHPF